MSPLEAVFILLFNFGLGWLFWRPKTPVGQVGVFCLAVVVTALAFGPLGQYQ